MSVVVKLGSDEMPYCIARSCSQNACMPTTITIRNVPSRVRDELAARAARAGRSLQEHLRAELIALANRPSVDVLMMRVQRRKRAAATRLPREQILQHRDAGRR